MPGGTPAQRYAYARYAFAITDTAFLCAALLVFQASGLSALLAQKTTLLYPHRFYSLLAYTGVSFLGYSLLAFPLHFFQSFVLEHRFQLSRQRFGAWLLDRCKEGAISYLIIMVLLCVFMVTAERFARHWWLLLSLFWVFFSVLLAQIAPLVLIPLFFKCRKTEDQGLRQKVLDLAAKMRIKLLDVYEFDLSSKTIKANAALTGMGRSRRVLVADTLKANYTHEEIGVIIAHELAHHKLRHIPKLIAVNGASTLALFYLVYKTSPALLRYFAVPSLVDLGALPLLMLYALAFAVVTQPLGNFISRQFERNADACALRVTGDYGAFISAFQKLSAQNLADHAPHPLIKFFFFDHPPIDERIATAGRLRRQAGFQVA
ncbi:MAG: M48 family metallopeptidase [Candidatus Omnitrophica bacterium]|nr:M48 family metallopeptidase [Candidatus Omnitrophota bacterium]